MDDIVEFWVLVIEVDCELFVFSEMQEYVVIVMLLVDVFVVVVGD